MTDDDAERLGRQLCEMTAIRPDDVDLFSLGRIAVKLAKPYIMRDYREKLRLSEIKGD